MKNIAFYIALILFPISNLAYSQTRDAPVFRYTGSEFKGSINKFIENHQSIGSYISAHVSHNNPHVYSFCHQGVSFIRFRLDDAGLIQEIACSKTTPSDLSKAFRQAIIASEKYWIIKKKNKEKNKWLVQPVIYNLGINCDKKTNDVFLSLKGSFFQFDDGSAVSEMNCLMFEPWITSSGVDEVDLVPPPKN